jgi:hypothetical protein
METILELPVDLLKEVELRAVHEGRKLKDTVADLLRKGLRAGNGTIPERSDEVSMRERKEVADKFISGEWSVELPECEAGRAADREFARERDQRWRS